MSDVDTVHADELDLLGDQLDAIAGLEVSARPAVFERINEVLAGELAALEEV